MFVLNSCFRAKNLALWSLVFATTFIACVVLPLTLGNVGTIIWLALIIPLYLFGVAWGAALRHSMRR